MPHNEEEQLTDLDISEQLSKSLQPKWVNSPTVKDLAADYTEAQADHSDMVTRVGEYLDNLNVEGKASHTAEKGRSTHTPQVIRKQAEWRYSSLSDPFLSTANIYNVNAITHEDKPRAEQNSLILNNQWNTSINKQKFVDDWIHTGVDEGTVIVRTGWKFEEREEEEEIILYDYFPDLSPENMQMMQQAQQLKAQMPDSFNMLPDHITAAYAEFERTGIPYIARPNGSQLITTTKVIKNHPTVEVVKFTNVVIDPTCEGDLDSAMFAIYSFETSHSALKSAGNYSNLDEISSNADAISDDDQEFQSSFRFSDKPRQKFTAREYWGFWDIHDDGIVVPIVATYVGDVMIEMRESPYPDGKIPFTAVQYLPKRFKVHGEPDGELLLDNQKVIGAVTRGMIDLLGRSANSQIGHRMDALDPVNRIKFRRGEDYEFTGAVTNPEDAFHMHKYPEIPQSAGLMLQLQNQDAESLTGVKAFTSGITGNALGDTVGGQRNALDATAKREVSILRRFAKGLVDIGNKIMAMNDDWLSEEEVTRITNKPYIAPRKDGTKFDLRVTVSTADEDNAKASELSFMLQTIGPSVNDWNITKMLLIDFAKLRKMPALAQALEEYEPQPDPVAVENAQLENQLLQMQIAKTQAEIAQIQSNAGLNGAKTVHEEAKTEETKSKGDLTDLNFVEQESGVTQERAIQLIEAKPKATPPTSK